MRKPNTQVVTRRDLIRNVTADFAGRYTQQDITRILDSYEWYIKDHLLQVEPGRPVQIRLLNGLQLNAQYIPETVKNTVYQDHVRIPAHIQIKGKCTRYMNRALNNEYWNESYREE